MLHTSHVAPLAVPPSKIVHSDHPVRARLVSRFALAMVMARPRTLYGTTQHTLASGTIQLAHSEANALASSKSATRVSARHDGRRAFLAQVGPGLPAAAREGALGRNRVQHAWHAFRELGMHHRAHGKERVTWPMPRPLSAIASVGETSECMYVRSGSAC